MSDQKELSRRDFARLLSLTGVAAFVPTRAFTQHGATIDDLGLTSAPLRRTPLDPDEKFWKEVRSRFLVPPDLGFINAANVCCCEVTRSCSVLILRSCFSLFRRAMATTRSATTPDTKAITTIETNSPVVTPGDNNTLRSIALPAN